VGDAERGTASDAVTAGRSNLPLTPSPRPPLSFVVAPVAGSRAVRFSDGRIVEPPNDWVLVPPGDPGLTRRVKAAGPTWTIHEKVGRKTFSHGVWAAGPTVENVRVALAAERATPQYAKKRQADANRRETAQAEYVLTFHEEVLRFLAFHERYADLAASLAEAVTAHATPVGSGTVARTERIPVEQRAEAAVIAWMRHQTTAYDHMHIPRVKGKRREVRRLLAARSKSLLETYRRGHATDPKTCPLLRAIHRNSEEAPSGES
jgi:hypothetical protein